MSLIDPLRDKKCAKEIYDIIDAYGDEYSMNKKDSNGNNTLMYLITQCSTGKKHTNLSVLYVLRNLNRYQINLNTVNNDGNTALSLAIKNRCEKRVIDLINSCLQNNDHI